MNHPNQEILRLATQTDQFSVTPGGRQEIPVDLANLGSTPDQVRISVEGIPLLWVSAEQQVVFLQPGEQRRIGLTIQPPAPPNVRSGRYNLKLIAASAIDPGRTAQAQVTLTVAGFEVKGRVGVLLDGVQFAALPGEQLVVPIVLINQGLGVDTFHLSAHDLPQGWVTIPAPIARLEPGEVKEVVLLVQSPRQADARAGRYPFRITVASQEAPEQSAEIDCALTLAAFVEFKSTLEAAQPEQNLPARVLIHNLSNIPISLRVAWSSPEDSLTFEPGEPQPISLPAGETARLEYNARPSRRPFVGGEKTYPYTVTVQASDQQTQALDSSWAARGVLPVWLVAAALGVILLLIVFLLGSRWLRGASPDQSPTGTALVTSTATVLIPTATQSQVDQLPLLVGRTWHLVAFNDTRSSPGVQEPFTLFNPDGTLIGYTGCKDMNASYQTNFNQISVSNINLGSGACPDAILQQQEDALVAILRSARSYFVADTALQIAGDAGFLNYSLSPVNRPEEIQPPVAVINAVAQSMVGQVVVFDGSASTGQAPIVSWKWDFGDRTAASGPVVQHTYRNPGAFTVRLTVTDQGGQTGTTTQQIHILTQPTATVQPTLPPPTLAPPTATTPPEQPTSTPEPPLAPPTATPELLPEPIPPQANISGPRDGFIGEPVAFDASASQAGGSPIVSYNWTFGNGTVSPLSPDPRISTIYDRAGDYEVTVFVVDANGLSSYATTHISIDARLDSAVWTLASINGQPLLTGTAITLQFLEGRLAGFAGCNTYDGAYTASDNGNGTYSVVIQNLTTSRKSCPADIMIQENAYLEALRQTSMVTIQENMAILDSPAGVLVFYLINPS